MLRSVSDADFHLVYTGESDGLRSTSEPYYYIYNIGEDGGFVMVSGDDRVDAVIGYGLSGAFDPNKIPANMAGWFKEYERQIDFARTLPERVFPETSTKAAASDSLPNRVEPLITTQWDQLTPYNLLCPMVGYQRTPTGCGATAMAQILNYHKWPERATGTGSYTVPELGGDTTYVDLSQFTFDWANMADVYDENATTEQREAVAELMFAAGAAINMVYSTTWSYSQYNQIPEGFVTHMGYDENLAYLMRNCYDSDSWESTIKKELAEKRPVFYMAQSIRDGHYFVCDGYVSSPGQGDYFHINWGWGGMRNITRGTRWLSWASRSRPTVLSESRRSRWFGLSRKRITSHKATPCTSATIINTAVPYRRADSSMVLPFIRTMAKRWEVWKMN